MATSRTGTSQYKKARKRALHLAKVRGITHCPYCNVELDYDVGLKPNSAETDHVIAHARGGADHHENLAVCCRRCNQSKGDRPAPKTSTVLKSKPLKTSRRW
ncbi:HNH endonuclease [Pseudarthrobacter sp. LT1]|uniref:HNH endonuclease n=1 Tax=Pseudarthrobacter sp. LT1 TaxID=3111450 RepID=UPI002D77D6E7|nr:HNH endonuclease [Pseudarthrobacter sp. LT1]WRT14671.1 HNH endonuclease [Pseudarthrobacter sp. LT1]